MAKQNHSARYEQEGRGDALEAYLLEHASGLREHDAAQHRAFIQIEGDAYVRHPDPTPDDIAAAEAAEAALPSRKRTEAQLRRSFALWLSTSQTRSSVKGNASFSRVSGRGTEPTRHP
jgi:hypothetical protein